MGPVKLKSLSYQQITDFTSVQGLLVPTGAEMALLNVRTNDLSWRSDGSTTPPSATGGMLLSTAQPPFEFWGDLTQIKFAAVTGSPVLNIEFYKRVG